MNQLTTLTQALLQSRRTFVLRSAGAMAFPLALVGCGGGGSDSTPTVNGSDATVDPGTKIQFTAQPLNGSILLPGAVSIPGLSIQSMGTASTSVVNNQFAFNGFAEGPILVGAFDATGNLVLAGLLDATHLQLSAATTALVLASYALSVSIHPSEIQDGYTAVLTAPGALDGLASTISAAIQANGAPWMSTADAGMSAAMAQVFAKFGPTALQTAAGDAGRAHALGVIVVPTDRTSGLLANADGIGKVVFQNYYRRRVYLYAERMTYTPRGGLLTNSHEFIQPQPIKVPSVKSLPSILILAGQLIAGVKDYYDPISISPIAIPLYPSDAAVTRYQVTAVGLGNIPGGLDVNELSAEQLKGLQQVSADQVILEIVLPLVINFVLPHNKKALKSIYDFAETSTILRDLSDALLAIDTIGPKIQAGKAGDAIQDILLRIVNTSSLRTLLINLVKSWADVSWTLVGDSGLTLVTLQSEFVDKSSKALTGAMAIFNAAKQGFDTLVIMNDLDGSHPADRFTFDTTPSVVKLNPLSVQADHLQAPIPFTASVIDAEVLPNSVLSYRWHCECLFGDISDALHSSVNAGTTFNGSSDVLAYNPTGKGSGGDTETVTVQVFLGAIPDPIDNRQPLGQASSTITYNVAISPSPLQLQVSTQQIFTAAMSARVLESGVVLQYVWTLSGTGSIGAGASVPTTSPSISYTAPANPGTDTLSLKVLTTTGGVITQGSVTITTLGAAAAGISPQNPRVPRSTLLNFTVASSGASFPSGTTFRWVLTNELDVFGRVQNIGASGGGTIGVSPSVLPIGVSPGASVTVVTSTPNIVFAANPFGPEAVGDTFAWNPTLILTVTLLGAGGAVLTSSSTVIQTQLPTGILLP